MLAACNGQPAGDQSAGAEVKAILPEGSAVQSVEVAASDLPEGVRAAVLARLPGMEIAGAERKERDGRIFYDVEGRRSDGSEVELDVLDEGSAFRVVEVQRDIAWRDVPQAVTAAAEAAPIGFVPARVIESTQNDGTIIFELFAPGRPGEPAAEVDWKDGKAAIRQERNAY